MKRSSQFALVLAVLLFATLACSAVAGLDPARQQAVQTEMAVIQTSTAALREAQTALARPTFTSTVTATPRPSATVTPTPGPLVIDDDFSTLTSRWADCDICSIRDGKLQMGPYPSSNSSRGYFTTCRDCGIVRDYKMSVDATFVSGVSDRGFGFVLREWNGDFIDLEISTWQIYGLWFFDSQGGEKWYTLIPKGYASSAYLNPGLARNHMDVEVFASETDLEKDMVKVMLNGKVVKTVEIPKGNGRVGLALGLHSIAVAFDNFHFEGKPLLEATDQNSG